MTGTVLLVVLVVMVLFFLVLFIFSIVILSVHKKTGGAMFVPTAHVMIRELVASFDFTTFSDIRELGCGDGRFLLAVEKNFGVCARGYEINPVAFFLCRVRLLGCRSKVFFRDFWKEDMSGADCIFCYLFPDIMGRLGRKLSAEMKPGSVVISANFPVPGWKHSKVITAKKTIFNDPIYVYIIGET